MARKKQKTTSYALRENRRLEQLVANNFRAIQEGPKKKKWSSHDLKCIKPLTAAQGDLFHAFFQGNHICAYGSAGSGKTFLGMYLALNEVLQGNQQQIIIVRSAVTTRDLGFMPGDLNEKMALYEAPYKDICAELVGRASTYADMKEAGVISFMATSYIRGLTWDNAIILVEEGQNMSAHEINSIMTRVGQNTRVIFTGDLIQTDLRKNSRDVSGMAGFLNIIARMDGFEAVEFTVHDIVRSEFVKSWIIASEGYDYL